MKTLTDRDSNQLRRAIDALDLDPIKVKLMDPEEGEGWSRTQVDRVERLYKRFLFMSVTQSTPIVPTKEIDKFWHTHILDTRKYARDCEVTFGFFLHHFPYFGMRGEQDAQNLVDAFAQTQEIYLRVFGEPYVPMAGCSPGDCGNCGGSGCTRDIKDLRLSQGCSSCGQSHCDDEDYRTKCDAGECGVRDDGVMRADERPRLPELSISPRTSAFSSFEAAGCG